MPQTAASKYLEGTEACQLNMRKSVDAWLRCAQDLLWPPRCVLCGQAGQSPALDLCAGCAGDLRRNVHACEQCAEPLSGEAPVIVRCGACLRKAPRFDQAFCPFIYAYPVAHLVRGLKFSGQVAHGRVLGELLAAEIRLRRAHALPDLLIPVPLAQPRYRQRGYNQATELAQCLQRRLKLELRTDLIERTRDTPEQAGLDRKARRRNIKGAFQMCAGLPAPRVAIVDDVITTGSTANELAQVLKQAGAQHVEVWAVARAAKVWAGRVVKRD